MAFVTRGELSELDQRIAASVARGEAAIARGEAAIARQNEATAQIKEISARMDRRLEHAEQEKESLADVLVREIRSGNRELITEMRADRERQERAQEAQDKKFDVILDETQEVRDERRAVLEGLRRVLDRLPEDPEKKGD